MWLTKTENDLLYKLNNLIDNHGYWSKEVNDFNSSLSYEQMVKLNNKIKNESKI